MGLNLHFRRLSSAATWGNSLERSRKADRRNSWETIADVSLVHGEVQGIGNGVERDFRTLSL